MGEANKNGGQSWEERTLAVHDAAERFYRETPPARKLRPSKAKEAEAAGDKPPHESDATAESYASPKRLER